MDIIHARKRANGFLFRLWSEGSRHYRTPEMSEEELRAHLRKEQPEPTETQITNVIRIATARGTSDLHESSQRLDSLWQGSSEEEEEEEEEEQ